MISVYDCAARDPFKPDYNLPGDTDYRKLGIGVTIETKRSNSHETSDSKPNHHEITVSTSTQRKEYFSIYDFTGYWT